MLNNLAAFCIVTLRRLLTKTSKFSTFVGTLPQRAFWPRRPSRLSCLPLTVKLAIKAWTGYVGFRKTFLQSLKNIARVAPSKSRKFVTVLCSSMVALTPSLFKCPKLHVYTLLTENKLNDLWAIKYIFCSCIICVGSCTCQYRSMKSPDIFRPILVQTKNYKSGKKIRKKSRECHNHKPQSFSDPKRKRKPTNPNKHKPNKRTKSTKISSLFPKRDNRNTKSTEKHKNKMTHGKTYNKSPRRINHKATKNSYLNGQQKQLLRV